MVDYIECYPEYFDFEKSVRFFLSILNFSFISQKFLCRCESLILPIIEIYFAISSIFAMMYFELNLMKFLLWVITIVGCCQLLIKTLCSTTHPEQFNIIFLFIQQIHQVHRLDLINNFTRIHLKKTLNIIKKILK